jgi:hypothetical protein
MGFQAKFLKGMSIGEMAQIVEQGCAKKRNGALRAKPGSAFFTKVDKESSG